MNLRGHLRFALHPRAFTLIEIMIVVAIMGIVLAMGMPSFFQMFNKEGMRKAVSDLGEACNHARAQAIMTGQPAYLTINPHDGTFSAAGFSSQLPQGVRIEFLGINFVELQEAEEPLRVTFNPNGTSDEFVVLLISDRNEARQISLEIITGLVDVEVVR